MNFRVSIIGCGNIGAALASTLATASHSLRLFDSDQDKAKQLAGKISASLATSLKEAALETDVIVLSVKPPVVVKLLPELVEILGESLDSTVIVSVAAGVSLAEMQTSMGKKARLVRAMPNLAMEFGQGVTALYSDDKAAVGIAEKVFSKVGKTFILSDESKIAIATGVSGSGPAFICRAINGMVVAAEKLGLEPARAQEMAAQTALGAALMILEGAESPESIIQRVTTPGGTTAQGLEVLKENKFEEAMAAAVEAAVVKAKQSMSK